MRLNRVIAGDSTRLIPLADFQNAHNLPPTFTLTTFLGGDPPRQTTWRDPDFRDRLEDLLLRALPDSIPPAKLPEVVDALAAVLRAELFPLADGHSLPLEEIEAAVLDLRDLLLPAAYRLIELAYASPGNGEAIATQFDIHQVIGAALDETTFVAVETSPGTLAGGPESWQVALCFDQFGPIGLKIEASGKSFFVADETHQAPAARMVQKLAQTLGDAMAGRLDIS